MMKAPAKTRANEQAGDGATTNARAGDGGNNYLAGARFPRLSEMMAHYQKTIAQKPDAAWRNIMLQYERAALRDEDGCEPMPSFGAMRYKVRRALSGYVDYATEREQWATVKTYEGRLDGNAKIWSDHITSAFQEYCIDPWDDKFAEIMKAVRDMLLFRYGVLGWLCGDGELYPQSIEVTQFWPDREAGADPRDFDVCYMPRRFTAVELYRAVEGEEAASANGWNRPAVLALIRSTCASLRDDDAESIYLKFSQNAVPQAEADFVIDCVIAFVKEYRHRDDGSGRMLGVSKYVFPAQAFIPTTKRANKTPQQEADDLGFLLYQPHSVECMSKRFALVSTEANRKYHEGKSFAELIYTVSKTYDLVMNRILQAVEDNMRVYFKSASQPQFEKLKRMKHRQYNLLEPGVEIVVQQLKRPIQEAAAVLRSIVVDQNAELGDYAVGELAQRGQPKTAKQSEIDLSESLKIDSAELKMFNAHMTRIMREIYRRWCLVGECDDKDSECYRNYQRFVKYLTHHGVPPEAWAFENVKVSSVISLGAGSPAARLQASRVTMEALSVPAASPGERRAQREMIAAVQGINNVNAYIPPDEAMTVPEDSLIGLENDALASPGANPPNIPVLASQLHFRHIPAHIQDAFAQTQAAIGLMQNRGRMPSMDEGVMLKTITDILIGIDNTLAHAIAHMKLAARTKDKRKIAMLDQFKGQIAKIQKAQDDLNKQLAKVQQDRMQQAGQQMSEQQMELAHRQSMFQLEEEHTARMLAFDAQKQASKAEQLREQSAANTQHKQMLATAETVHKEREETIRTAGKLRREALTAKSKQQQNGNEQKQKA